ncbi:BMP family ABC transporter substrate-binding protein [Glaciimonas soli]|nr:BMP family ABC transporter substrate-binding protein [Glaciimonas soli]
MMSSIARLRCLSSLLLSVLFGMTAAQAVVPAKIVYVRPVPQNDDAFLQQGTKGVEQAATMYQLQASTLESQPNQASRQQQLDNAVKQGAKIVVMIGYEFKELAASAARAAPQTRFVIMQHCVDNSPPNLTCVTFRESEPSYLAGMEAALTTSSNKVGMIGPIDSPLKRKNGEAFAAGAKAVNSAITVHAPLWVGGTQPFDDPSRAEAQAKTMLGDGVDVIFAAASGSNRGIFKALSTQPKAKAIGSDINQCSLAPGRILDNVQTHADTAISVAVGLLMGGSTATHMDFGMKEGAVSLTGLGLDAAYSECDILRQRPAIEKLRVAKNAIIRGTLKVD